jgi:hypothetical protein
VLVCEGESVSLSVSVGEREREKEKKREIEGDRERERERERNGAVRFCTCAFCANHVRIERVHRYHTVFLSLLERGRVLHCSWR